MHWGSWPEQRQQKDQLGMHIIRKEAFAKKMQILQEVYKFFCPSKSCTSTYTVTRFFLTQKGKLQNLPYSFSPDCFVQSGVNANIRSTHFFHRKFTDFLESTRCSFLEAPRMNTRAISLTSGNCQHWILVAAFDHWHSLNIQSKELCSTAVQHLHHSMTRPLLS